MLKKTIVFTDFDGNEQIEDFYFNITKAELLELELLAPGKEGINGVIEAFKNSDDRERLINTIKMLTAKAVGVRSEDGKRFIKTSEITNNFMQSSAYSELFMELILDANNAAAFVNGIIPKISEAERQKYAALAEKAASSNVDIKHIGE